MKSFHNYEKSNEYVKQSTVKSELAMTQSNCPDLSCDPLMHRKVWNGGLCNTNNLSSPTIDDVKSEPTLVSSDNPKDSNQDCDPLKGQTTTNEEVLNTNVLQVRTGDTMKSLSKLDFQSVLRLNIPDVIHGQCFDSRNSNINPGELDSSNITSELMTSILPKLIPTSHSHGSNRSTNMNTRGFNTNIPEDHSTHQSYPSAISDSMFSLTKFCQSYFSQPSGVTFRNRSQTREYIYRSGDRPQIIEPTRHIQITDTSFHKNDGSRQQRADDPQHHGHVSRTHSRDRSLRKDNQDRTDSFVNKTGSTLQRFDTPNQVYMRTLGDVQTTVKDLSSEGKNDDDDDHDDVIIVESDKTGTGKTSPKGYTMPSNNATELARGVRNTQEFPNLVDPFSPRLFTSGRHIPVQQISGRASYDLTGPRLRTTSVPGGNNSLPDSEFAGSELARLLLERPSECSSAGSVHSLPPTSKIGPSQPGQYRHNSGTVPEAILSNSFEVNTKNQLLKIPSRTDDQNCLAKYVKSDKTMKLLDNMKVILSNTNASLIRKTKSWNYSCFFCDALFKCPSDLKKHALFQHKRDTFDKRKDSNIYDFELDVTNLRCTLCQKRIAYKILMGHLSDCHSLSMHYDIEDLIMPIQFSGNKRQCGICLEECSQLLDLLIHIQSHYRKFSCGVCNTRFLSRCNMENHKKSKCQQSFLCKFCSAPFQTNGTRKSHENSAHIAKKFSKSYNRSEKFKNVCSESRNRSKENGVDVANTVLESEGALDGHIVSPHHSNELSQFEEYNGITTKNQSIVIREPERMEHKKGNRDPLSDNSDDNSGLGVPGSNLPVIVNAECASKLVANKDNTHVKYVTSAPFLSGTTLFNDLRTESAIETEYNKSLSTTNEIAPGPSISKSSLPRIITDSSDPATMLPDFIQTKRKVIANVVAILRCTNANLIRAKQDHEYACYFCSMLFKKPSDLKNHALYVHVNVNEMNFPCKNFVTYFKLDITDLQCKLCDTGVPFDELIGHLSDAHRQAVYVDIDNKILPVRFPNDEPQCSVCRGIFNGLRTLLTHVQRHYGRHVCDECGKRFLNIFKLTKHKMTHEKGDYPCNFCPLRFRTRFIRKRHEAYVHDFKRIYKCGLCDQRFKFCSQKDSHLARKHNVEVTYKCNICDKVFPTRYGLSNHMRFSRLCAESMKARRSNKIPPAAESEIDNIENRESTNEAVVQYKDTHVQSNKKRAVRRKARTRSVSEETTRHEDNKKSRYDNTNATSERIIPGRSLSYNKNIKSDIATKEHKKIQNSSTDIVLGPSVNGSSITGSSSPVIIKTEENSERVTQNVDKHTDLSCGPFILGNCLPGPVKPEPTLPESVPKSVGTVPNTYKEKQVHSDVKGVSSEPFTSVTSLISNVKEEPAAEITEQQNETENSSEMALVSDIDGSILAIILADYNTEDAGKF